MFQSCIVAALVLASPAFAVGASVRSSLTFDAAAAKNRPVSKVVTLLKDVLKQLEKEKEMDEEIYDKMACWCETNDKEKSTAIQDAENRIRKLEQLIEGHSPQRTPQSGDREARGGGCCRGEGARRGHVDQGEGDRRVQC